MPKKTGKVIMHNRIISSIIISIFLFSVLSGCDENKTSKNKTIKQSTINLYKDIGEWKVPRPMMSEDSKDQFTRPTILIIDNNFAVLSSTAKEVTFTYKDHKVTIDKSTGSNKLWLFANKKNNSIYTLWWKKTRKGKRLYFRRSVDNGKTFSKKVILNSGNGILPTIGFSSSDDGKLVIAYYDERQPPYRIYTNHSSDNGVTWQQQDTRMDNDLNTKIRVVGSKKIPIAYAVNPLLVSLDSGKLVLIWQQRKIVDNSYRVQFASRTSKDFGKSWSNEKIIYTADISQTVESAVSTNGKTIALVAAFPKKGLLAFVASDNLASENLNWTEAGSPKGTTNVNEISWLRPAISGNNLKVAYIIQKDVKIKYQVEVASMDLNKAAWGNVFRLDRAKKQPVATKATYHDLKVLPNGEFMIVWQDSRNFIPMLLADYTSANGTKWQDKPISLTRGGLSQIRYPNIYVGSNKLWIAFEWYIAKGGKLPKLSMIQLDADKNTKKLNIVPAPQNDQFTKAQLKEKLHKRVTEFMDLRVKREWEKSWEYNDPVYREVTNKETWLRNIGFIIYEKYKVDHINIEGNFATIDIDLTVSLRQQFRKGEIMEPSPPKRSTVQMKWLWFYDDWYMYPDSAFIRHLKF